MERIKFLKHRGGSWHKGCIAKVILLASLFFIQGCSYLQPEEPLFQGISNRGMIPVSPTNAYVGSNLFLSQQMENSPELYHFIESRGAPHAIRVNERPNRNPELIMYYPREDALYIAELSASRSMYNWIARGPHKIPRYESATLSQPSFDVKGEPLLALFDREIRFPPKYPQTSLKTVAIPKLPEIKPPPKPARHITRAKPAPKKSEPPKAPTQPVYKPLNMDQMAIQMSQGFAERDKNGDLIHTVKSDAEKIEDIAKWYTGDVKNGDTLLKATGLEGIKTLTKGLRIRVPFAHVKNTKQMTE